MAFAPTATCDTTIDVSHWQGKQIDWTAVRTAGKRVAMIKATQGTSTDDTWLINRAGAQNAGLLVIPYTFLSQEDAAVQVDYFVKVAGLTSGMPAALDWEGNGAPVASLVEAVGLGVANVIGRDPLGYWGIFPPGNPTPAMTKWPRWIPRYGVNNGRPDYNHPVDAPWLFWQYSSAAQVNGISGKVDASLFSGSEAELTAWYNTGALPASLSTATA